MSRAINLDGFQLIQKFEGCKLEAYKDGRGIFTLGYGHTAGVHEGQTCNQMQADEWLEQDLIQAESAVSSLVKHPLNDNQFAALVAFVFNIGVGNFTKSTLLRELNAGQYDSVPGQLALWNHINGEVSDGLKHRRDAEIALWKKGA